MLTGVSHEKAYSHRGGVCHCNAHLKTNKTIFACCSGWFGTIPYHLDVDQAKALVLVLTAVIAEHDAYQAALSAEYGPMVEQ